MKRHILSVLFLFTIFQAVMYAQSNIADSSLFPLSVGNKNIFLKHTTAYSPLSHYYSFDTIKVTSSKIANDKKYYLYDGAWLRYDSDSLKLYALQTDPITSQYYETIYINFQALSSTSINVFGVSTNCLLHAFGGFTGPGSAIYYDNYYAKGLGIAAKNVRSKNTNSEFVLIGMINSDSINGYIRQDESAPIISEPACVILNNSIYVTTTITHKFSKETDSIANVFRGCNFIKSAQIEYFFANKNDTLFHNTASLDLVTETSYKKVLELNESLFSNGYKFYYRIISTDNALVNHTTIYPQEGFNQISVVKNTNLDNYPLKIGNNWLYNRYIIKDTQKTLIDRNEVKVIGDTIIPHNNMLYYIVKRGNNNSFERIDSLSGIVYSAHIDINNQVIEKPIYSLYEANGKVQSLYRNGTQNSFICLNDSINVFNNYLVSSKSFTDVNNNSNSFTICKGIGLYSENYSSNGSNYSQELEYAKVGEKTFGSKISPANILNRLPLNIGDEFIYERSIRSHTSTSFTLYDTLTIKIEKDSLLSNNFRYFKLVTKEGISLVRVDSVFGYVYKAQVNNNDVSDALIDNLYAFDNQTLQISYFDELSVFRYSISNSLNNLECITAVSPYDSRISFTRCFSVGVVNTYRLKKINEVYTYFYYNLIGAKIGDSFWGDYEELTTGNVKPTDFDLSQNYPNPFNPSTTINYSIPKEGLVKIKLFDILGREVALLVNSQMQAGSYKVEFNSAGLASGVYIYSLFVDNNLKSSKKMLLMK